MVFLVVDKIKSLCYGVFGEEGQAVKYKGVSSGASLVYLGDAEVKTIARLAQKQKELFAHGSKMLVSSEGHCSVNVDGKERYSDVFAYTGIIGKIRIIKKTQNLKPPITIQIGSTVITDFVMHVHSPSSQVAEFGFSNHEHGGIWVKGGDPFMFSQTGDDIKQVEIFYSQIKIMNLDCSEMARDLLQKFEPYANDNEGSSFDYRRQCALIFASGILTNVKELTEEAAFYWQEVVRVLNEIQEYSEK